MYPSPQNGNGVASSIETLPSPHANNITSNARRIHGLYRDFDDPGLSVVRAVFEM
jgi:hypothetical protein